MNEEQLSALVDDELDAARDLVVEQMSTVTELAVPLDVDTATGTTWFDAQKH